MLFDRHLIIIAYVIPWIIGYWVDFSVDYFKGRKVSFVCLLTCGKDLWYYNFTKYASSQNIAVSVTNIDNIYLSQTKYLDLCLKQTATATGVLISTKCVDYEKIMISASENVLFDSKHKWLIIEERHAFTNEMTIVNEAGEIDEYLIGDKHLINNENDVIPIEVLSNLNLSVDADITLSIKIEDSSYKLYEVYNFGKARNGKFVMKNVGLWNVEIGLNITKEYIYYRRWDFQQMAFESAIVMSPVPEEFDPAMVLSMPPDRRVASVTHKGSIILNEIAGIHNFRFNYTVHDRWVGDYIKGHQAVTNALYFREQDITPILRYLSEFLDKFDMVAPPIAFIKTRFYYRIPGQGVGKFENQFLRPLSPGTWWCVVGVCLLCCVVLLMTALVENRPVNGSLWCYSVSSVLAMVCQQFFEEAEDTRRISEARKVTILVTGVSCILIYNYYTSSVVSWLLNGAPPSINSLWELVESPLQPIFADTGYTYSWLQLPNYHFDSKKADGEDALKKKAKKLMNKGITLVKTIDEGIKLVKEGGYAFHVETNAANARISKTFDQQELCDLDSLHSMEKVLLYTCVQKNSPYREFFSWSLARLLERGIIQCMHERTWNREVTCEGSSPRALALGGAAPAFIVLASGFVLGTLVMLVERFWWNYSLKNKKSSTKN